jgi:hypothetical protein
MVHKLRANLSLMTVAHHRAHPQLACGLVFSNSEMHLDLCSLAVLLFADDTYSGRTYVSQKARCKLTGGPKQHSPVGRPSRIQSSFQDFTASNFPDS